MALTKRPYITERFVSDWVYSNKHPVMPAFNLPEDQREDIASYLVALRHPETAIPDLNELAPSTDGLPEDHRRVPGLQPARGFSTGFYVSPDGYVVTSAHGTRDCGRLYVLADGRRSSAELIDTNEDADLALVRSRPGSRIVLLSSRAELEIGMDVTSFGFPLPSLLSTDGVMGFGQINAMRGALNDSEKMQLNIPAYPGSSGSPVFDKQGHVVGMITGRINRQLLSQEDQHFVDSITFAAKLSGIRNLLRRHGVRARWGGQKLSASEASKAAVRMICEHYPF